MNTPLKLALVSLAFSAPLALPSTAQADPMARARAMKVDAAVEAPKLIAVRVHHDRCPYCKKLAPQFDKLSRQTADAPVLFVTLDLSSEASQHQAAMLVAALGIDCVWTGDMTGIGTVYFVDPIRKSVVSTYRAYDAKESLPKSLAVALAGMQP